MSAPSEALQETTYDWSTATAPAGFSSKSTGAGAAQTAETLNEKGPAVVVREASQAACATTFQRYVAPSVVDRVLRSPDEMRLGGHRREVSILFADIRGYTTFAEQADPERVVEMLNAQILTTFPGFIRLSGSSARLIARITSTPSPCSASRNFILP